MTDMLNKLPDGGVKISSEVLEQCKKDWENQLKKGIPGFVDHKPAPPLVDMVNKPPHYTKGGIECIEAIKASLSQDGFNGYLKAAVIKYLWRYEHKGKPVEDLKKAEWYLKRLIEEESCKS